MIVRVRHICAEHFEAESRRLARLEANGWIKSVNVKSYEPNFGAKCCRLMSANTAGEHYCEAPASSEFIIDTGEYNAVTR